MEWQAQSGWRGCQCVKGGCFTHTGSGLCGCGVTVQYYLWTVVRLGEWAFLGNRMVLLWVCFSPAIECTLSLAADMIEVVGYLSCKSFVSLHPPC